MTQRTPDILSELMTAQPKTNPLALTVPAKFTRDEWEQFGARIAVADNHFRLAVGDWIIAGEQNWGDTYTAAEEITGYSNQYLRDCAYVARNVELSLRDDKLAWSHLKLIAKAPEDEKAGWVGIVVDEGLTKRELAKRMAPRHAAKTAQSAPAIEGEIVEDATPPPASPPALTGETEQEQRFNKPAAQATTPPPPRDHSDTRLRDWFLANLPDRLSADPVASAINAMDWMLAEIERVTSATDQPAAAQPDPVANQVAIDFPNWAYGWNDDDQAQYEAIGDYWGIDKITRQRVALRYIADEGAGMFPSLENHYQQLAG